MRTLHRYLTRQVMGSLVMTVCVFTFVLLLANVLKEVLALLVSRQASLASAVEAIGLLIPFVLAFSLPMGLLTAMLLTFGRLSADNELTAVRASGVSLLALITPLLVLSLLLSGVCAAVNLEIAPRCRIAYKQLLWRLGVERFGSFIPERTYIKEFRGYVVYFGGVSGTNLENILIWKFDRQDRLESSIVAERGSYEHDREKRELRLRLMNVVETEPQREDDRPKFAAEADLPPFTLDEKRLKSAGIDEMSFLQLRDQRELLAKQGIISTPLEVRLNGLLSFSFAGFAFTLIGIPLGIRAHRRETSMGFAMALLLVMVFYSFHIVGNSLDTRPQFWPQVIVWLPNFLFQAVGLVLLRRANHGM